MKPNDWQDIENAYLDARQALGEDRPNAHWQCSNCWCREFADCPDGKRCVNCKVVSNEAQPDSKE